MPSPSGPHPRRFGPYPVDGVLGRGGMGVVYRARDPRLERAVAIKVLIDSFAADPERLARFEREARALASLNHPNIATIYGLEELEDGTRYIVLELIEGMTLAQRLASGPLPVDETLRVAVQIAGGLEAAHERHVVHRDLKPANVMLTPKGLVKLMDFGLAKAPVTGELERETIAQDLLSGEGFVAGTPGYMSPEQVRGLRTDERTDLFAFGVLLYEALTGNRAFTGRTPMERALAVMGEGPDLDALPGAAPAGLRELIRHCLERDPEQRLQEAARARHALERMAAGEPMSRLSVGLPVRVPNNLPGELTSFVGREDDLRSLGDLLNGTSLLTLRGTGGCGKTRLALAVARERMPGFAGVWFVELAAVADPARVPHAVASALGIKEERGVDLTEALVARFRAGPTLLILDNCEHLIGACRSLVADLLRRCDSLTVLATSREELGVPGEQTYPVLPLTVPEAGDVSPEDLLRFEAPRLFVERARLAVPHFEVTPGNSGAVAAVCRRLDGIPLAVELAAARVKALSPDQILDKLRNRFRLLTGGSPAALPHHETLRAAVDWSYLLLPSREQELLRIFSVFVGGWTLEGAGAVAGDAVDEFEVLDGVTQLVRKSLVVTGADPAGGVRYGMLDTIRHYGREKLEASGDGDAVVERHRDVFLDLAERAEHELEGPRQKAWLERLEAEHHNLLAALAACRRAKDGGERGLRMAGALWRFWYLHGPIGYGRAALADALDADTRRAPTEPRAKALNGAGALAMVQADYAAARAFYEESLEIRRAHGDVPGTAKLLNNLGILAWYQGNLPAARALYEESLSLKRTLGNEADMAATLNNLGSIHANLGNPEAARALHEESLDIHRRMENREGISLSLHNLGIVSRYAGDYPRAMALHRESLGIERDLGNKLSLIPPLFNLAVVACRSGEADEARACLTEALELVRETGDKRFCAYSLEAAAELAATCGRPREGAAFLEAAGALRRDIGSPLSPAEAAEVEAVARRLAGAVAAVPGPAGADATGTRGGAPASAFDDAVTRALDWLGS